MKTPYRKHKTSSASRIKKSSNQFPIIGVGASAGGLEAFKRFIMGIQAKSGMAYILVQHLDPAHESLLPELLQKITPLPVREIGTDMNLKPDHIYIVPNKKFVVSQKGALRLQTRNAPKGNKAIIIDQFFIALAEIYEENAVGVVLSGMASDGTRGLRAIKEKGGLTFVQDEASASYWDMPNNAIQAGIVDFILPPEAIPAKIEELVTSIRKIGDSQESGLDTEAVKQMLELLRSRKGADFTFYKQTTIKRRILRRMSITRNATTQTYLGYLRKNSEEQDLLFQDFLIPVTSFFRDEKIFESLAETVFSTLFKNKKREESLRIWVAGCSTGEEVYSIAICLKEQLGDLRGRVQIFATDLSEQAISKARTGIYPKESLTHVSEQRIKKFFTKMNGSLEVKKELRELCVFAVHDFLKDPPFGKLDLISCRNVLIYMESYLQARALSTFHYALNPKGILLLGKSETITVASHLFGALSSAHKIFQKKDVPARFALDKLSPAESRHPAESRSLAVRITKPGSNDDVQHALFNLLLTKFTPSGVIVNDNNEVVFYHGDNSQWLQQASGKPSNNILKLVKNSLGIDLRNILHKVRTSHAPVSKKSIALKVNGTIHRVSLEATPLPGIENHFLILFHLAEPAPEMINDGSVAQPRLPADHVTLRILELERELAMSRQDMQTIIEEKEFANEQLQSTNEELQSGSEELQSLNEELETSKEELQSTNEELIAVNQQLVSLNKQIIDERDFANSIISTVRGPLLVLDTHFVVRSANRSFYKFFLLAEHEVEGKIIFDISNKQWDNSDLRSVLTSVVSRKTAINDIEIKHQFPTIGFRSLLLNVREIIKAGNTDRLILLSIEDITERQQAQEALKDSKDNFERLVMDIPAVVYCVDTVGAISFYNNEAIRMWGGKPSKGANRWWGNWKVDGTTESRKNLDGLIKNAAAGKGELNDVEVVVRCANKEKTTLKVFTHTLHDISAKPEGVIVMAIDVTEQQDIAKKIRDSENYFRRLAELTPEKIFTTNPVGKITFFNKSWQSYTGKASGEALSLESIIHPDNVREFQKRWRQALKKRSPLEMELRFEDKNHKYKWHLCRIVPVDDKHEYVNGWIGSTTEIQTQREQKEELEHTVRQRTNELQLANTSLTERNDDLQRMNKELQSFAYVSSHDLQEPLRKIQVFVSRIFDLEYDKLSEKAKDSFNRINDSAQRMQLLILDLLSYSRAGYSDRKLDKIVFKVAMADVIDGLKETIEDKKAKVTVAGECSIEVIPFQFHQMMVNLISNSLKFSAADRVPKIKITCRLAKGQKLLLDNSALKEKPLSSSSKYYHIQVVDNGIGFEGKYAGKIFEVFQRLFTQDDYAGTGIGLAIVKRVVENHRGLITASGRVNKGATFDIYLPQPKD